MNDDTLHGPSPAPELPDDFARRVIARARLEQLRQRVRRRIAIAAAMLLVAALPLARLLHPTRVQLASRDVSTTMQTIPRVYALDTSDNEQLARAVAPDQLSDYLMPNTAPLRAYAATYSDAAWNYDPNWPTDR
jgi:hypothetical protein